MCRRQTWVILVTAMLVLSTGASTEQHLREATLRKIPAGQEIAFTLAKPTDVTVRIVDADRNVVRHLACGMVGLERAAKPFAPNTLTQKILWDGKDDAGKPVDAAGCKVTLGIGVETEIWGLRKTCAAACPELARYIGEVNRLKRRYPDILIRGTFRDTVGASVGGEVYWSVLKGERDRLAVVLRNPHDHVVHAKASLPRGRNKNLQLWRPFAREKRVRQLPVSVRLKPYEVAVLLAP